MRAGQRVTTATTKTTKTTKERIRTPHKRQGRTFVGRLSNGKREVICLLTNEFVVGFTLPLFLLTSVNTGPSSPTLRCQASGRRLFSQLVDRHMGIDEGLCVVSTKLH